MEKEQINYGIEKKGNLNEGVETPSKGHPPKPNFVPPSKPPKDREKNN